MPAIFAHLRFNGHGLEYENAIKGLSNGYAAALLGLEEQANRAAMDVDDYDVRRDQDQLEPFEQDQIEETGYVYPTYRDILLHRLNDLETQTHDLRIAYALMLYHQWERSARSWTKKEHGKFEGLVTSVEALGLSVDPKLDELRLLVNVIKHNSKTWGEKLAERRPDILSHLPAIEYGEDDWFIGLTLSHEALTEFFYVVARSGPNMGSDDWDEIPPF